MLIVAAVLLQFTLQPDSALRLVNPGGAAVEANVTCGGRSSAITVGAQDLADLAPCVDGERDLTIAVSAPLLALETTSTTQQLIGNAECPILMSAPLFACKNGSSTVAVPELAGASYNWTIEGATLVSGAGTSRLTVNLTDAAQAKLSCVIVRPDCTSTATSVISVRDPLAIGLLKIAPAVVDANVPVTVEWSYAGTSQPAAQLLTGDALAAPVVLSAHQRSYTFVPANSGNRGVELQASYGLAVVPPSAATSGGRRRSAGKSIASASACADARAGIRFEVRGCVVPVRNVNVPANIEAGSTFDASVFLDPNETAQWSVTNGTLLGTSGGRATVRADQEGNLFLAVRIERDPSCFSESTARVIVKARSANCPVAPTALVELIEQSCEKGTIRVTFTGSPRFSGRWSDGTPFETTSETLTREVKNAGDYSISQFRDGLCSGTASGVAHFTKPAPKVVLSLSGGACTNAKVVARFTGTPPFVGKWHRGTLPGDWFETNHSELTVDGSLTGTYWIEAFGDSRCPFRFDSESVNIVGPTPVFTASTRPACAFYPEQPPTLVGSFDWGPPPYTVYWADGTVTRSDLNTVLRQVPLPQQPLESYDIVRATTGNCEATIPNKRVTATFRVQPRIDNNLAKNDMIVCAGKTGSAHLANTLPPNATINWTVESGEIVSGQGTPAVTYRQLAPMLYPLLRATATYPDGACSSFDHVSLVFPGDPTISDLRFDPPVIKAGGTSTLTFNSKWATSVGFVADPTSRYKDLSPLQCSNFLASCTAVFKDTQGAGTVKFTLQYFGDCLTAYKSIPVTLTIEP